MANGGLFSPQLSEARDVAGSPTSLAQPSRAAETGLRALRGAGEAALNFFEGRRIENIETQTAQAVNAEIDQVIGPSNPTLDADLKGLDRLQAAVTQGTISRDAFFTRVDARVSSLKRNNPGFEDVIDARVRHILGQDPRQALLSSSLRREQERDALEEQILGIMVSENAAVWNEDGVGVDRTATLRKAPQFFQNRQKIENLKFRLQQEKANGGGGTGGRRGGGLSPEETSVVNDLTDLLYEQTSLFTADNLKRLVDLDRRLTPEEIETVKREYRQLEFNLNQSLNNQISEFTDLSEDARKLVRDRLDAILNPIRTAITDPNVGIASSLSQFHKAMVDNSRISFFETAPKAAGMMAVFGDGAGAQVVADVILRGDPSLGREIRGEALQFLRSITPGQMMNRLGQSGTGELDAANLPPEERRAVAAEKHRQALSVLRDFNLEDEALENWGRLSIMDTVSLTEIMGDEGQLGRFVDSYFNPNVREKFSKLKNQAPAVATQIGNNLTDALNQQFNLAALSLQSERLITGGTTGPDRRPLLPAVVRINQDQASGEYVLQIGDGSDFVTLTSEDFIPENRRDALGGVEQTPRLVRRLEEAGVPREIAARFLPGGVRIGPNALGTLRDDLQLIQQLNQVTSRMFEFKDYLRASQVPGGKENSLLSIRQKLAVRLGLPEDITPVSRPQTEVQEERDITQETEVQEERDITQVQEPVTSTTIDEESPINPNIPRDRFPVGVAEGQPFGG